DMNLAAVIDGDDTIPDAGKRVLDRVVSVASGEVTKAELSGYFNAMDIFMQGPVI
ncbi:MAG: UxaA family hydrolase, partial [Selenomonadales bacterium]|nr:UxaA family hydrolase [Selenomonadales bacterium]